MPDPASRLLDVREAAAYLGVTERWIRRRIERRTIDHVKLGRLIRFRQSTLDALIESGTRQAIWVE